MKIHPICEKLPWMTAVELQELADNIKQRGQQLPCYSINGEIVDGKNRIRACELAGIKPWIEEVDEKNVAAFVASLAVFRRHLTTSQRAMFAAELAGMAAGRPNKGVHGSLLTNQQAADRMRVSHPSVKKAKKVIRHAVKPIRKAVIDGKLAVSAAATVATLPKQEQRALAEAGPDAVRDKAAEMRSPWPHGAPPDMKSLNGETKRAIASQARPDRETKPAGNETVAVILKHLDKWWASEKRNLCSYPPAAPQRIWDLVRAEIVKVGA